jgi:hypothetical protein
VAAIIFREMCTHENLMQLRLMTYTPYGPMLGCLACGNSWLVRDAGAMSSTVELAAVASPARPTG